MDENKTNPMFFPPNSNAIVSPRKNRDKRLRPRAVFCTRCQHRINHPSSFKAQNGEKSEGQKVEDNSDKDNMDLRKRKRCSVKLKTRDAPTKRLCKSEVKGMNSAIESNKSKIQIQKTQADTNRGRSKKSHVSDSKLQKNTYKDSLKKKIVKATKCVNKKDKVNSIAARSKLTPLKCKVNLLRNSLNIHNGSDVTVKPQDKGKLQLSNKDANKSKVKKLNVKTAPKSEVRKSILDKTVKLNSKTPPKVTGRKKLDADAKTPLVKLKPQPKNLPSPASKEEPVQKPQKKSSVDSNCKGNDSVKIKRGRPPLKVKHPSRSRQKINSNSELPESKDFNSLISKHNGLKTDICIRSTSRSPLNLKRSEDSESDALNDIKSCRSKLLLADGADVIPTNDQNVIMRAGDVVWGKVSGFPWWPALVKRVDRRAKDNHRMATISWFASNTKSVVPCAKLAMFLEHYKTYFSKRKRGTYLSAVSQAKRRALKKDSKANVSSVSNASSTPEACSSDIQIADSCFAKMSGCDLTNLNNTSNGESSAEHCDVDAVGGTTECRSASPSDVKSMNSEDSDSDVIEVITDAEGNLVGAKNVGVASENEPKSTSTNAQSCSNSPIPDNDHEVNKNEMCAIVEQTVSDMVQKAVSDMVEKKVNDMVEKGVNDISDSSMSEASTSEDEIVLECSMEPSPASSIVSGAESDPPAPMTRRRTSRSSNDSPKQFDKNRKAT